MAKLVDHAEWAFATLAPSSALAETDACTLLTPAQVAAAIGEPVGNGQHVTPTFVSGHRRTSKFKIMIVK